MKFLSALVTNVSGSIGGMTGSHNKGGLYFRARTKPTQTNTPRQQAAKAALSNVSKDWNLTLTQAQRAAWAVYAKNVPMVDKLGAAKLRTANQMFVRSASPAYQIGLPLPTTAPTTFNLGQFTTPTVTSVAPATITIAITESDKWTTGDNSFMLFAISRQQNVSKTFFKSPFQLLGAIVGSATTVTLSHIADPTSLPVLTNATTGGTIPIGTFYAAYTWGNGIGQTLPSPAASTITTTATSTITIAPSAPPANATTLNCYIGASLTTMQLVFTGSPTRTPTITALPGPTEPAPPTANTTGNILKDNGTGAYVFTTPFIYTSPGQLWLRANVEEADGRYGSKIMLAHTF